MVFSVRLMTEVTHGGSGIRVIVPGPMRADIGIRRDRKYYVLLLAEGITFPVSRDSYEFYIQFEYFY
jgi:hypothetical protein